MMREGISFARFNRVFKQNRKFFASVKLEWDNGGAEAFLHELAAYDLTNFDVRQVPQTAELAEQKLHSQNSGEAFIYAALSDGHFHPESSNPLYHDVTTVLWQDWVETSRIEKSYRNYCAEESNSKYWLSRRELMLLLKERVGAKRRRKSSPPRSWGYEFPSLEEARVIYTSMTGIPFESDEPEDLPEHTAKANDSGVLHHQQQRLRPAHSTKANDSGVLH
jgi:hypothetical protein